MPLPRLFPLLSLAAAVLFAGCEKKPAEVTVTRQMQTEVANLLSEADFATQLHDYARAEPLLAKAVTIIPDIGENWVLLGAARKRLNNTAGARTAYREALAVFERGYKADPKRADFLLQQVYVHSLLGQTDKARALLEKAGKDHPKDREIQDFIRSKEMDGMLSDPNFKSIAL